MKETDTLLTTFSRGFVQRGKGSPVWGFATAVAAAAAAVLILWLGLLVYGDAGPQTGGDHAVPATLAMLMLGIGVAQWAWLVPAMLWCAYERMGRLAAGMALGGLAVLVLNAPALLFVLRR